MLAFVSGTLNVRRYFTLSRRLSSYNLAGQVPSTCCSQFDYSGLDTSTCGAVGFNPLGRSSFSDYILIRWLFTL